MYLDRSWFGNKYSWMAKGLHDNRTIPSNAGERPVPMGPGGLKDGGAVVNGGASTYESAGDGGWVPDEDIDWDMIPKKDYN